MFHCMHLLNEIAYHCAKVKDRVKKMPAVAR